MLLILVLGGVALLGVAGTVAQEATPVADGGVDGGPERVTFVEHAVNVTITDLGEAGPSAGDLTVWGPDALFDEENAVDTGAVTQGSCQMLNTAGDNHCVETIVFPDGSTIAVQGVQAGDGSLSTTTIVGGSGRYLHASGTLVVEASADRTLWTKTLEIWTQ
jgi:hypothetical protein